MARKDDFKPDKPRVGLLSKLYLTKVQRQSLLKWVLYALSLVLASVVQDVLLCKLDIFGATTELVPCGIFLICMLEGMESGSVFALVAACLYLFSGSAAGQYSIVLITALGIFVTFLRQSFLQKGFGAALIGALIGMVLYELVVFGIGLFLGQTYFGRFPAFLLRAILTVLTVPVLYPLMRAIGKIGGEPWKE